MVKVNQRTLSRIRKGKSKQGQVNVEFREVGVVKT